MKILAPSMTAFAAAAIFSQAHAGIIFSQDFESGLGANESAVGHFSINKGGYANNGTYMMGHPGHYWDGAYDAYTITGLLITGTDAELSFDYTGNLERHFDRFNVLVNGVLATIKPGSDMQFGFLTHDHHPQLGSYAYDSSASTGGNSGKALIDLSAYGGQVVNLVFQFGADPSLSFQGVDIDNVKVWSSAVPEPSSLMLTVAGLVAVGAAARRRAKNVS